MFKIRFREFVLDCEPSVVACEEIKENQQHLKKCLNLFF